MNKALLAVAILAGNLCVASTSAIAADDWKWQGTIYGYFPDIGGTTTFPVDGSSAGASVDAAKIVDNLNFTFMGSLEARNGPWGFFTDVVYMNVGNQRSGSRDVTVGGIGLPVGVDANLDYDLKGWAWTVLGEYRLLEGRAVSADFVFGARLLDIDQTLKYELNGSIGGLPLPGRSGESKVGGSNWDAIVGVKGRLAFGEGGNWFVPYYVDVGTGDSKLTWQGTAGVGYAFKWGDVVLAWRYLDYEMKSEERVESLNFNGPALGLVFHW